MDYKNVQIIQSEGIDIAMALEGESQAEHPVYYPCNVLCYVLQGTFHIRLDNELKSFSEKQFLLIKKHTQCSCFKTWADEQNGFQFLAFALKDEFISDFLKDIEIPKTKEIFLQKVIHLPHSPILEGLMTSLHSYFNGNLQIQRPLVKLKTEEALMGMIQSRPELVHIFQEFTEPLKAGLLDFMEHHYTEKLPLEELAKLSGRSLSTFNRDFRKIFHTSPHQWIKTKRLELAKRLLTHTASNPSEVYLKVGFEDLAHFSKSFKKHFGINPSTVKKQMG